MMDGTESPRDGSESGRRTGGEAGLGGGTFKVPETRGTGEGVLK